MKIYEIKDNNKIYGYLTYYKKSNSFFIELNNKLKENEFPIFFNSFVSKHKYSINSYWSKIWVSQRIIPNNRQNVGDILLANKMKEYDEYSLLLLNNGKCSQDDLFIKEINEDDSLNNVKNRLTNRIEDVITGKNGLICFFRNGNTELVYYDDLFIIDKRLKSLFNSELKLSNYRIEQDGFGIIFNGTIVVSYEELYKYGKPINISIDDFLFFIKNRLVNTSEACEILNCSRQNINDLIKRDKLHPIRNDEKNLLFYRNEIEQRKSGV